MIIILLQHYHRFLMYVLIVEIQKHNSKNALAASKPDIVVSYVNVLIGIMHTDVNVHVNTALRMLRSIFRSLLSNPNNKHVSRHSPGRA